MEPQTVIQVEHLTIAFNEKKILDDISFSIKEGEFVTILGSNGTGKSTLLRILLGIYKPTSGQIHVLGETPRKGNSAIGYAPQHRTLEAGLTLRVRDIVGFGLDGNKWGIGLRNSHRTKQIEEVLREVDLIELANMPAGKLSGGEQQRLLIAQALLTHPKLLFLDEPLSNLDISHIKEIVSLIGKIAKERNITVLLVTHDINPVLSITQKVLYLANGHAALGNTEEVITREKLSELYGSPVDVANVKGRIFVLSGEEGE